MKTWSLLLLCCALPAQTVWIENATPSPYEGWVRCTVDRPLPGDAGAAVADDGDLVRWVGGREVCPGVRVVDLRVFVEAGEVQRVDLAATATDEIWQARVPSDVVAALGRPAVGGTQLAMQSIVPDGAGYLMHARGRVATMFVADLWAWWWPDQPYLAFGEVVVTCSNPTVPEVIGTVPANFRLTCGKAWVSVPTVTDCLLPAGETLADGQCRAWPLVLVWPSLMRGPAHKAAVNAAREWGGLRAYGLTHAWPTGDAWLWPDAASWGAAQLPGAIARLGGWDAGGVGPNAYSGDTGRQEDQCWIGGELARMPEGLAAAQVRYLVALGTLRRPCHYLEADGSLLDLDRHPRLVLWWGRPHRSGQDQLGKGRDITSADAHRWAGPDTEHWLVGTLAVAARATGSPALQWELGHHARLLCRTSQEYVGELRAVGWESLAAVRIYQALGDRAMAERVGADWRTLADRNMDGYRACGQWWWDAQVDATDSRATGRRLTTRTWQHGLCTYGLDAAGELFGRPDVRAFALEGAKAALANAWSVEGSRLVPWSLVGVDAGVFGPLVDGNGAQRAQALAAWMILSAATVLRHEPRHERALAIWRQELAGVPELGKWLPPELLR